MVKNLASALVFLIAVALGAAEPEVWFVHGWNGISAGNGSSEGALTILREVFPSAKCHAEEWDSSGDFDKAVGIADDFAKTLAERIGALPEDRRKNLTLVGHSLGGRIALRTVAELSRRNIAIGQAVFLAAAIPADDEDCVLVFGQQSTRCVNVYCPGDRVLKNYGIGGEVRFVNALGAGGYEVGAFHRQYCKRNGNGHGVAEYLACLKERLGMPSDPPVKLDVKVSYACRTTLKAAFLPDELSEQKLIALIVPIVLIEQCNGWRLYSHKSKNDYMIIDPMDQVRAIGTEKQMRESFDDIKRQLAAQGK